MHAPHVRHDISRYAIVSNPLLILRSIHNIIGIKMYDRTLDQSIIEMVLQLLFCISLNIVKPIEKMEINQIPQNSSTL